MNKKDLLKNVFISIFSIVFFFFAFELVLSSFWPSSDCLHENDVIGGRLVPNIQGNYVGKEFFVRVKANSFGFRDVEHDIEKQLGTKRIVLLGDSFTEALQVPLEETYARRLEKKLNNSCSEKFEVINLGVSGFGPANYFLALKHYGIQFKPDLVVVAFYNGNDFDMLGEKSDLAYMPKVTFEDGKAIIKDRVIENGFSEGMKRLIKKVFPKTYIFLKENLKRASVAAELSAPEVPSHFLVFQKNYDANLARGWEKTKAVLSAINAKASETNAKTILVSIPAKFQLSKKEFEEEFQKYPKMEEKEWDLLNVEKELEAFSKKEGIEFLPLVEKFSKLPEKERVSLYYKLDGHFSGMGHKVASEALFEKIKEIGECQLVEK